MFEDMTLEQLSVEFELSEQDYRDYTHESEKWRVKAYNCGKQSKLLADEIEKRKK